ncbi:MAG: carbohydrate binding domain-containing protein, partial [bacterium]
QKHPDIVNGNLIQFKENGFWCWYQDERAVVDTVTGNLVLAAVASASGPGGWPIDADINAVIFNINTMRSQQYMLKKGGGIAFYCDDHNEPALLVRPDGKYLAMYAAHFNDTSSYYRIYDGNAWGPEHRFNWNEEITGGSNFQTCYSNLYHLSAEGKTYNFARTNNKSPNSMVSTDMGDTWAYGGQLTTGSNIGYNNGYYKYNGNGIDRIDFICTEYHPRDYNTSIYHGYIKNGKSYTSEGTMVDDNILNNDFIPDGNDFTTVFAAGTVIKGMTMYRCWNMDVQRYEDGTIAALISARINNNEGSLVPSADPDHAFIYCRYNGTEWSYTYLAQAGLKLLEWEQDYTGLGALHPDDPHIIYISTPIDPRDDADLGVHEIFKGVTDDQGATWQWFPLTRNSVRDNLRPIIPAWDENHTALLWLRGSYFGTFDAAVVGLIEDTDETIGLMTYVDATTFNTTLVSGEPFVFTGPSPNQGPADDKWHIRSGFANGDSVFASGETGGEDAPVLKTEMTIPEAGSYDVWVNFWANPEYDWRIKAGLTEDNMQLFRQMACKQVQAGEHTASLTITDEGNTFLYQAYLGRIQASSNSSLSVYIDDETIENGTSNTMIGDIARTWYDGISYAMIKGTSTSTNLLVNGDFSQGLSGWNLYTQASAAATFSVVNGECCIYITKKGSEGYHVQLNQQNLLIEKDKSYTVSFDAYADANKQIYSAVGLNSDPWTLYSGIQMFNISPIPQTYTYSFTMSEPTDNASRLIFDIGLSTADIVFDNISLTQAVSAVDHHDKVTDSPQTFLLQQNYPNPFNATTNIRYSVPRRAYITLKVFNLQGEEVAILFQGFRPAGDYLASFEGTAFASGIYFYQLKANKFVKTKRLLLLK